MKSSQTHNENKKEIDKHISDKKKAREDMDSLQNETGDLVIRDTEKGDVPNDFFASVFTSIK